MTSNITFPIIPGNFKNIPLNMLPMKQIEKPPFLKPNTAEPNQLHPGKNSRSHINNHKVKSNSSNNPIVEPLRLEEAEILLKVWKKNSFFDFNNWCQNARAYFKFSINEHSHDDFNGGSKAISKTFVCSASLEFKSRKYQPILANGWGKSKKDAKKDSIEKVVKGLVQNNIIHIGLKDKSFLARQHLSEDLEDAIKKDKKLKNPDPSTRPVKKTLKKMQQALKDNRFSDALTYFYYIMNIKTPEWNELSHLWGYAVKNKNIEQIKVILDLVQYKRVFRNASNEISLINTPPLTANLKSINVIDSEIPTIPIQDQEEEQSDHFNLNQVEKKIQEYLKQRYGQGREKNIDNPYDLFDAYSVEMNDPKLMQALELQSQEEVEIQLNHDPFTVSINDLLNTELNQVQNSVNINPKNLEMKVVYPSELDKTVDKTPIQEPGKIVGVIEGVEAQKVLVAAAFSNIQKPENTLTMNRIQVQNRIPTDVGLTTIMKLKENIDLLSRANPQILLNPNSTPVLNQIYSNTRNPPSLQNLLLNPKGLNNNEIVSEIYMPPQTTVLQTVQAQQNIIELDRTKNTKVGGVNYFAPKLIEEMYELLKYSEDINFAFQAAEVLFSKSKVNDEEFLSNKACAYWCHKLNLIMTELLELKFQELNKINSPSEKNIELCTVKGAVEKLGFKFREEVIMFVPLESEEEIEKKIITKGGNYEQKDCVNKIGIGELVYLFTDENTEININQITNIENENKMQQEEVEVEEEEEEEEKKEEKKEEKIINEIPSDIAIDKKKIFLIAMVKEINLNGRMKLTVLPSTQESEVLSNKNLMWTVTKIMNQNNYNILMESVKSFCSKLCVTPGMVQLILTPNNQSDVDIKKLSEYSNGVRGIYHPNGIAPVNRSQQIAIQMATSRILTLIHGPPGTGKTFTAVEIVMEWLRRAPLQTVLVCSEDARALNSVYELLEKCGAKVIKLGNGIEHKKPENKQDFNPKYVVFKNRLREAQVVCTSCIGAKSELLKSMVFTRVIIEEAAQSTEIACIVPIIKNCQQLVLLGDHKQTMPFVLSPFSKSKGLTISLFERLINLGIKPFLLNVQYQMHPTISMMPSYQFYNNEITDGINDDHRQLILGFRWPNPRVRVACVNVIGAEKEFLSSFKNEEELQIVLDVLVQFLRTGNIKHSDISIITPYEYQKKRINTEIVNLAKRYSYQFGLTLDDASNLTINSKVIDVGTVDDYQNGKKELVILSTVRSNKEGALGILHNPRKMNFMLTQAKRGLIIIGNMETLCVNENWKAWYNWAQANQIVVEYKGNN